MKPDSIRAMVRRKQLPAVLIGRLVMFKETDLVAFLEAKSGPSADDSPEGRDLGQRAGR